ncbi:hypothetical protein ACVWXQ_004107 [Bradyrhizobium sp. S3.14.4]
MVRKSSAPALMACTVVGVSACPVRNMIGSVEPDATKRVCKSGPLSPGIHTSSRMHPGCASSGAASSKSCADA